MATKPAVVPEATREDRVIHEFPIPESIGELADPLVTSIGLIELYMREEQQAIAKSGRAEEKVAYAIAQASLVEVNGEPLDRKNGGVEKFWSRCPSKLRQAILRAVAHVHNIDDDELESFLKGGRVKA